MSKTIEKRIEAYKEATKSTNELESLKMLKKEVEYLLKTYKPASVRRYLTIYRKGLVNHLSVDVRAILTIPQNLQNKIEKRYTKKVAKRHKKLISIKKNEVMIQKAVELLESEKWFEIAAGLCLLTGRRATEVLKTAKLTNCDNSQSKAFFRGQLKSKGLDKSREKYPIYILGESKNKCKDALKRLRKILDCKSLSNEQTTKKYNSQLNNTTRKHFGKSIDGCTAHDLRKAYAAICTKKFKDEDQTNNSFLAELMGHSPDDLNTANSYQKFYLK
jgi:hypothetical protein